VRRSRRSSRQSLEGLEGLDGYLRAGARRRDSLAPALGLSLHELAGPRRRTIFESASPEVSGVEALPPLFRSTARVNTEEVKNQMVALAGSGQGRVQVQSLEKHGFTTEDLSRVIYDKFRETDLPEFLDYVELEKRGGLDRLGEIWSAEKYLWFAVLLGSVLFNITYLISMDWAIFQCYTSGIWEGFDGADLTNVTDAYSRLMESNAQTADVFKSRAVDKETRRMLMNIAALVASWEMCWIFVKVAHSLYVWCLFALGGSEYRSFHALTYFFQKLLPQFGTFSAIKLMARVHPSLIYNEYLHFVSGSFLRGTVHGQVLVALYFAVKCLVCGLAAVGAFTIKLLAVSMKLMNPTYSFINRLGAVLSIMLQCMGCVVVEIVLQDRLFLFVFGGQDAMYEDIEHAYKNVYEARVARQIWKDFWGKGKRLQAIVLLATFDHYDLQRLLIERLDDASDIEIGWEDNEFKVDHTLRPIMEASDECRSRTDSVEDVRLDYSSSYNNRPDASRSSTPRRQSLAEEQTSKRELYMFSSVEEHPRVAKSSLQSTASERTPRGMMGLFHELTTESQCSATSSSSVGMQVVTHCLKDQVSWRDSA